MSHPKFNYNCKYSKWYGVLMHFITHLNIVYLEICEHVHIINCTYKCYIWNFLSHNTDKAYFDNIHLEGTLQVNKYAHTQSDSVKKIPPCSLNSYVHCVAILSVFCVGSHLQFSTDKYTSMKFHVTSVVIQLGIYHEMDSYTIPHCSQDCLKEFLEALNVGPVEWK